MVVMKKDWINMIFDNLKQQLLIPINLLLKLRMWYYVKTNSRKLDNDATSSFKFGWEMTFYDNFKDGLNKDKWIDQAYFGLRYHPGPIVDYGKPPAQYYDPYCIETSLEGLKIHTRLEDTKINHVDWDGKDWGEYIIPVKTGCLESVRSFEQKWGYFEIRSKQPDSNSMWTAFWLASKYSWPPEIDIYEIWSSRNNNKLGTNTIHFGKKEEGTKKQFGHTFITPDLSKDYHTWGCEWNEEYIKIYFDKVLVSIYKTPKDFIHPMHVIINSGIDHEPSEGYLKLKDGYNLPNTLYVDYVKVYKKK